MKRIATLIAFAITLSAVAFAHEGNDHVRGVVTAVTAQAVTVQTADKTTKTLTLNDKTTFEMSGKAARVADLKVGDRVIVDVPKKTTEARLIKFGAPAPQAAAHEHAAPDHGAHEHPKQ